MRIINLFDHLQKTLVLKILSSDFYIRQAHLVAYAALHSLGPETMREYGHYRLRLLLAHAHRNVPYWRDIIGPDLLTDPLDMAAFVRLPVLTREILLENRWELLSKDLNRYEYRTFVTSGSTGIPKRFVVEKIFCQRIMATEAFYVNFFGLEDFKRYGYLLNKAHLKDLTTQIRASVSIEELKAFMKENDIVAVGGSLHRLVGFAEIVESGALQTDLRFVLSGSEYLSAEMKRYLGRIFRCPIYNKYVCAETGIMGVECTDRGGFHIDPVNCYLEIVDDQGAPITDGSVGRILITVFNNRLMPLIRYELGDTGHWIADTEKCSCGLQTPRLFFEGRTLEYVRFPDGRKYSALDIIRSVDYKFTGNIRKQQLIQESLDKIVVRFVPTKGNGGSEQAVQIRECVANLLRDFPRIQIEIEEVSHIDNVKNGKHRMFESRIGKASL